ncbi:VENN motif pre-toxin domain-containing protein, partial [Acerihabitans sp.]|uniref:VENN motif pre-toxin domain-containing protein n=1 Tax=Acerihabitans sp. TaxID=2811394 RepID=UPI002EDA26C2
NNVVAHAILGGVIAELSGASAAAGATGAAAGELAAPAIALALYGTADGDKLTSQQKQHLGALSTLASGIAAGVSSDSASGAVVGAQAGKNAVENNLFSPEVMPQGLTDLGQSASSYAKYAQDNNLPPEQVQADLTRMVEGDLPEGADIVKAVLSNTPVSDTVMAVLTAQEAKDYALALLSTIPAERALAAVGKAANVFTNKQLIRAAEKISTANPGKQFTQPRDLNEQILWRKANESPSNGFKLEGMNNDPRFPASAGFEKKSVNHKLPDGSNIEIHYQYNSTTDKTYDMKIVTPKRSDLQPKPSIKAKP